jgi:hypothetical protein
MMLVSVQEEAVSKTQNDCLSINRLALYKYWQFMVWFREVNWIMKQIVLEVPMGR